MVTTRLNLMELHYGLLAEKGKEEADKWYEKLLPFAKELDDFTIKKANELRLALKRRHLSYIDCLGYTFARLNNIPFLTGDKEFEHMENVEFVK